MNLNKIMLCNFRSFVGTHSFDIGSRAPGLYLLTGHNAMEPELGANGIGKSTLFEAVYWALSGRTSEGVKAGDVACWYKDKGATSVKMDLVNGHAVFRQWGPNKLQWFDQTAQWIDIDQQSLEQHLGMSPDLFLHSAYFAQHAPLFVDLPAAEQTALFTSLLDLEEWGQAAERAQAQATACERQIIMLNNERANIEGQLEALAADDSEAQARQWEQEQKKKIEQLANDLTVAQHSDYGLRVAIDALEELLRDLPQLRATQEQLRADVQYRQDCLHHRRLSVSRLKEENITECPTCGAPVDAKHTAKELKKAQADEAKAAKEVKEAEQRRNEMVARMQPYEAWQSELNGKKQELAQKDMAANALEQRLDDAKAATNPYIARAASVEQRGIGLATQHEAKQAEIEEAGRAQQQALYWVKGFKDIRLSMIHASLAQLQVEVNENLYALGLKDWAIVFEVEKENKSGGIRRQFTTLVGSPYTDKMVPWEAWSGGERQRLRLAISMGFANLITARTQPCNVEFYDEPTSGLNKDGINALLTVLAERAQRLNKIIFLADHRAFEFGDFAGIVEITKDQQGSHIKG